MTVVIWLGAVGNKPSFRSPPHTFDDPDDPDDHSYEQDQGNEAGEYITETSPSPSDLRFGPSGPERRRERHEE